MKKGYMLCPFCGEEIKDIAIKCRYCGEFLNNNGTNNSQIGKSQEEKIFSKSQENIVGREKRKTNSKFKDWFDKIIPNITIFGVILLVAGLIGPICLMIFGNNVILSWIFLVIISIIGVCLGIVFLLQILSFLSILFKCGSIKNAWEDSGLPAILLIIGLFITFYIGPFAISVTGTVTCDEVCNNSKGCIERCEKYSAGAQRWASDGGLEAYNEEQYEKYLEEHANDWMYDYEPY